ncbi:unnamed protein product [Nippostrongylus brasiliensis]|uniref:Uncharacterized protein n=1 Tax=Nippostrongylus brasiliensis TaxID=27835 RepID=A0A0N4XQF6_NIPBR|nr:unnamed protein product [Nippostrongylus brasiliensis]
MKHELFRPRGQLSNLCDTVDQSVTSDDRRRHNEAYVGYKLDGGEFSSRHTAHHEHRRTVVT